MAKVQGKKKAVSAGRRATGKVAARVKSAARAIKKKVAARKPAAPVKAAKKAASKAVAKVAKVAKAVKKPAAAPPKPTAVPPASSKAPVARNVPPVPKPAAPDKKVRTRRPRPRVHSNGAPVAAWLPQGVDKPRPSSFIPAPPRAEAPSLIAAPPASSDRLIRPEDVTEFVTRTVPVRVDIEQAGGRVFISVNPEEVTLRPGEGIEWDFRYLGAADVTVDELMIEFENPSPFTSGSFRSRKPGIGRPHRQLSGALHAPSGAKRIQYTIRAVTQFGTELASGKSFLTVASS